MKKIIFGLLIIPLIVIKAYAIEIYDENTVYYKLDINKSFKEKIVISYPQTIEEDIEELREDEDWAPMTMSEMFYYEDIEPLINNHDIFYDKKIDKGYPTTVTLTYEYLDDNFVNGYFINNCFEEYEVASLSNEYYIDLSGNFECYNDKPIKISVKTNYDVIETTGNHKKNEITWTIDDNNYKNTNIFLRLAKNQEDTSSNTKTSIVSSIFKMIIPIIIIVLCVVLLVNKNKLVEFINKKRNQF